MPKGGIRHPENRGCCSCPGREREGEREGCGDCPFPIPKAKQSEREIGGAYIPVWPEGQRADPYTLQKEKKER